MNSLFVFFDKMWHCLCWNFRFYLALRFHFNGAIEMSEHLLSFTCTNVVDHSENSLLLLSPTGGTYVMSHTFCSSQPTVLCKAEEGSLHFCVNILCVDSTKQWLVCYYLCWYRVILPYVLIRAKIMNNE